MSADVALAPLLLGSWPTSLEAAPQALAAGVTTVITTGGPAHPGGLPGLSVILNYSPDGPKRT